MERKLTRSSPNSNPAEFSGESERNVEQEMSSFPVSALFLFSAPQLAKIRAKARVLRDKHLSFSLLRISYHLILHPCLPSPSVIHWATRVLGSFVLYSSLFVCPFHYTFHNQIVSLLGRGRGSSQINVACARRNIDLFLPVTFLSSSLTQFPFPPLATLSLYWCVSVSLSSLLARAHL